jgi:hypothetical protein
MKATRSSRFTRYGRLGSGLAKMKTGTLSRCLIPVFLGSSFLISGLRRITIVGVHPLPRFLCVAGVFAIAVGLYYAICRLEFRDGGFIAHPASRHYWIDDVASWKLGELSEAQPGHRRYLELGFDKWYRRYVLFEEDVSSAVFDQVLSSLRKRKNA